MAEFIPPGTRWIDLPAQFPMRRGGTLRGARMAYETWGTPAPGGGNTVLILTGMSPDAHAAANPGNPERGWWEPMLGHGAPIDTDRWHVVCVNTLGSCKGSTGPASINPATGEPYRLDFPELSIEDCADAAAHVVRELGIGKLACVVGNSMGGMVALSLLARRPGIARTHLNISGAARALSWTIAIRSLQREAIRLDPHFANGRYDDGHYPESGMRMARKLGVITYRSALEWHGRFGRVRLDADRMDDEPFGMEFEVESYLEAHARRFVRSFDPNCYLYLSRSMDWFDLGDHCAERPGAASDAHTLAGLESIRVEKALAIGAETDILFPVEQQRAIAEGLAAGGAQARLLSMPSPQGHDAFLVDYARFGPAVRGFLDSI
ncbi:homoserine O-acetyltransferase [Lysobacter sp. GX 14042]|uniref:homoserine O-acetyltransferase MetX n=1 Tax=Lysobacter sp. GX 14042 TaxID=2907155 RepID=UPI001F381DCA|nr:homoserine O-acetyltransferase [Lysobacter sp. GX 14042]MCE7031218.1 homoserine O-acetyltransferase [Lysobacter sp. GX 14042]